MAKLVVGQGGQSTVDLASVDTSTSCLLLAMKWSKGLHTDYLPSSAHAEYCGGVVGDTPDDM